MKRSCCLPCWRLLPPSWAAVLRARLLLPCALRLPATKAAGRMGQRPRLGHTLRGCGHRAPAVLHSRPPAVLQLPSRCIAAGALQQWCTCLSHRQSLLDCQLNVLLLLLLLPLPPLCCLPCLPLRCVPLPCLLLPAPLILLGSLRCCRQCRLLLCPPLRGLLAHPLLLSSLRCRRLCCLFRLQLSKGGPVRRCEQRLLAAQRLHHLPDLLPRLRRPLGTAGARPACSCRHGWRLCCRFLGLGGRRGRRPGHCPLACCLAQVHCLEAALCMIKTC